jgi:hypothetical protein
MQLLVAVKKRWTGMVRRKIHLHFVHGRHNDYILDDTGRWFASKSRQFEAVPVQVNWARFITFCPPPLGDPLVSQSRSCRTGYETSHVRIPLH